MEQGEDNRDKSSLFCDGAVPLCWRCAVTQGMEAGNSRSAPTRWEVIADVRRGVGRVEVNCELIRDPVTLLCCF